LVASQEHEDKISDIALGIARSGHQILIFIKKGLRWPVATDHWEIRKLVINPFFFALFSIYKILKRKKKKHVSILLTDDAIFGEFLKFAKALHGADVVINPDKGALLKLLETKSTNGTGFN
jgi:hypothetical protein